jgi:hypothetical protein
MEGGAEADLTGFEPATSGLTGRRALLAAPQVRVALKNLPRQTTAENSFLRTVKGKVHYGENVSGPTLWRDKLTTSCPHRLEA